MPSLQFSWAPWDFDQETVELSRKFVELHEEHADYILERFALAVSDGHPGWFQKLFGESRGNHY